MQQWQPSSGPHATRAVQWIEEAREAGGVLYMVSTCSCCIHVWLGFAGDDGMDGSWLEWRGVCGAAGVESWSTWTLPLRVPHILHRGLSICFDLTGSSKCRMCAGHQRHRCSAGVVAIVMQARLDDVALLCSGTDKDACMRAHSIHTCIACTYAACVEQHNRGLHQCDCD